jgi:hypothetical protein
VEVLVNLHPFYATDGGHHFHGGVVFPIEPQPKGEPVSANLTNVLPFPGSLPTLEQAVAALVEAKRREDAAKSERLACEELICKLQPPKEEGATTVEAGGFKVTITGSLSYKVEDLEALRNITRDWDANIVPLKTKTELDATGCKWLRANRPELWGQLASVITIKPAKAAVKVGI